VIVAATLVIGLRANWIPTNWDVCDTWDEKGIKLTKFECVNAEDHIAVVPKDLVINPLTTKVYSEIHLRNGVVLKD
jgi:hypothetical protein